MTVAQMRLAIKDAYDGPAWENKVSHMSDSQVIAIYYSFKEKGKLVKKPKRKDRQMTIYDYI